jgi:predicted XRE-type DNA-binding protein
VSFDQWERKVLEAPGAGDRVREIEEELRLAAGLTALREQAGLSQRELAERMGVSQPRVAALGRHLEVSVVRGRRRTPLLGDPKRRSA